MNLIRLIDWFVHLPRHVIDLICSKFNQYYSRRFVRPLTISAIIGLLLFKYLSKSTKKRFSSPISSKLFEDFNRFLLLNANACAEENEISCSHRLPLVLVDLEAFDRNIEFLRAQMLSHRSTTIRIASKSIRVPFLLNRILSHGLPFQGIMAFAVEEAQFLCQLGFDDILIGYPSAQKIDYRILKDLHDKEKKLIRIVVDNCQTIEEMNEFLNGITKPFPLIIEFDASFRLFHGMIHFGARRSPIRTIEQLIDIIEFTQRFLFVKVEGIMVYESHIAGIGDSNPANAWLNPIIQRVKASSFPQLERIRKEIARVCSKYGLTLFNGGGTGSLLSTLKESSVLTEITVGSAFFQPHLFDHYQQNQIMNTKFHQTLQPSCYFALPVVRISDQGQWITCAGGGYVASGRPGWDKVPLPVYPPGLIVSEDEGTGEVQTPLKIPRRNKDQIITLLNEHGIVYFRHAKRGELAERFNQFLCLQNGKLLETAKTYRGYGKAFF